MTTQDKKRIIQNCKDIVVGLMNKEVVNTNFIVFVLAQACWESAWFTSPLFIKNNNPFGMRHPKKRPSTSLGTRGNYAYYKNVVEAAEDYYLWTAYNHLPVGYPNMNLISLGIMTSALKDKQYYEDTLEHYIYGVWSCLEKLQKV
jgi:hypothetical protein